VIDTDLTLIPTSNGSYSYAADVILNDLSSDSQACSAPPPPSKESKTVKLKLVVYDERAEGSLLVDTDVLEFTAPKIADTGFTNFLTGTSVTPDIIATIAAASACPQIQTLPRLVEGLPPECAAPLQLAGDFSKEFAHDFSDKAVLRELSQAVALRAMVKKDGTRLLPTLHRLLKPIALLAIKADKEGDESAKTAMRRLINIAIALDLAASR
jgi:hypothetical protein